MLIFFYVSVLVLGLIIGSFLNCLIFRLHSGESMLGRSHCRFCQKMIAWYDNIPVFSFLFLSGKCRHCQKSISAQYPLIEAAVAILFVLAFFVRTQASAIPLDDYFLIFDFDFLIVILRDFFLISVFTIVFVYDLRWYMILDKLMFPAMVVLLLFAIIMALGTVDPAKYLLGYLFSGIIGGGFFLVQYLVSRGRWIGGGDIRLGFFMGLALPWPQLLVALTLAYFFGAFVGIFLILSGRKQFGSKLPFGVFLSAASLISLFWGPEIIDWYMHISY